MRSVDDAQGDGRPFAVIDIGSNSGRMIVFRLRDGGHLDVLDDARAPLRLSRELAARNRLGEDAIQRTVEALADFKAVAAGAGASRMLAVATSAVREAADGHELVRRAAELGVDIRPISGDLEATLGFIGAAHDLPCVSGVSLDVGGGSVELVSFLDRKQVRTWSLPIGALRMSDSYLLQDPPSAKEMAKLRGVVAAHLAEAGVARLESHHHLVGMGGTVRNLARIDLRRNGYPLPLLHGYELSDGALNSITKELAKKTMQRRGRIPGLNPDRSDSILGGALVVQAIIQHLGAPKLIISSRGLREGLALGADSPKLPPAEWVRDRSVAALASRFATWQSGAAERRRHLALRMHAILDVSGEPQITEMLGHAATLLDVGRAIDYYERFDHAATIATMADLAGFAHDDLGILAAILRQADEDARLGRFGQLIDDASKKSVLRASTILALAEELHRRIPPSAPSPLVNVRLEDVFEVAASVPQGWRPRRIADRFREVFGVPLVVRAMLPGWKVARIEAAPIPSP